MFLANSWHSSAKTGGWGSLKHLVCSQKGHLLIYVSKPCTSSVRYMNSQLEKTKSNEPGAKFLGSLTMDCLALV